VAADLTLDGRDGEGEEVTAEPGFESVDREEQAEAGDLGEVFERLTPTGEALRDVARDRQVAAEQLVSQLLASGVGPGERGVLDQHRAEMLVTSVRHVAVARCSRRGCLAGAPRAVGTTLHR
jgi:hypothetical protein